MNRFRDLDTVQTLIEQRFYPGQCRQSQLFRREYVLVLAPSSPETAIKIRSILWDEYAAYNVLILNDREIYFDLQTIVHAPDRTDAASEHLEEQ